MNSRLREFDLLRVAATFAVIAIHITAGYVLTSQFAYLSNQFVRFAVPLFIIMSGFLLYFIDLNRGFESGASFYKRRFTKILYPYIIWSVIYCIVNYYLLKVIPNFLEFFVGLANSLIWGTASYHLYFLVIIFQLYFLYPLLRKWFSQNPLLVLGLSFVMTLIAQTLLYLNMIHVIILSPEYINAYLVAFPVWIFYFILGMYSAWKKDLWERTLSSKSLHLAICWIVSLILLIVDSKYTLTYGSSIRPSVILYTISTYVFFYVLSLRLDIIKGYWLSWLANQSFLIFLLHPLILIVLVRIPHKIGLPDLWAHDIGMISLYITTAALTLVTTYVISLTPVAVLLGGAFTRSLNKSHQTEEITVEM